MRIALAFLTLLVWPVHATTPLTFHPLPKPVIIQQDDEFRQFAILTNTNLVKAYTELWNGTKPNKDWVISLKQSSLSEDAVGVSVILGHAAPNYGVKAKSSQMCWIQLTPLDANGNELVPPMEDRAGLYLVIPTGEKGQTYMFSTAAGTPMSGATKLRIRAIAPLKGWRTETTLNLSDATDVGG